MIFQIFNLKSCLQICDYENLHQKSHRIAESVHLLKERVVELEKLKNINRRTPARATEEDFSVRRRSHEKLIGRLSRQHFNINLGTYLLVQVQTTQRGRMGNFLVCSEEKDPAVVEKSVTGVNNIICLFCFYYFDKNLASFQLCAFFRNKKLFTKSKLSEV